MTEKERQEQLMVGRFAARVAHYDLRQLRDVWRTLNRESVGGEINFGDWNTDQAILSYLRNRICSLEQAAQGRELTPAEQEEAEAEALVREHHVSIATARNYLRKHAKPAPEPEPPLTDHMGQQAERAAIEAHYRVPRNTEGSA
jgi:hypothetical protein